MTLPLNNISPTTHSSLLIADPVAVSGGSVDSTPSMTTVVVNSVTVPVQAIAEFQTTQGTVLLPRLTTTQINALTATTSGMMVYDTTLKTFKFLTNGAWAQQDSYTTMTLSSANITGMFGAPVAVTGLAAPGAGLGYIIKAWSLNVIGGTAYTGGGVIDLQYGNAVNGAGPFAAATMPATAITAASTGNNRILSMNGGLGGGTQIASSGIINTAIFISNATAAFATGNGTAVLNVWYSVVAVT